jgi:hypothetical protein
MTELTICFMANPDSVQLATQFPDLKGEILALPLSPTRSPAVHTSERPNWALAPDEPSTPTCNEVSNRGGRRKRGGRHGHTGPDTPTRLESKVCSPAHTPSMKQGRHSRSRTPSRSPKKRTNLTNLDTTHKRMRSVDIPIIAPSPTYICLSAGSSVVVTDGHRAQPGAGGMPNPTDVDALILELQKAHRLGGTGFTTPAPSHEGTPNESSTSGNATNGVTERGNILTQIPKMTPILPINRGRPSWIKDKGGILRPDFRLGTSVKAESDDKNESHITSNKDRIAKGLNVMDVSQGEQDRKPDGQSHTPVVSSLPESLTSSTSTPAGWSTPKSQMQATPTDHRCTPSPLRQTMLQRVNEILLARERSRSGSPLSSRAPTRVTSPVLFAENKVATATPAREGFVTLSEKMERNASPVILGYAKTPGASPAATLKIESLHILAPASTVEFPPSAAVRSSYPNRPSGSANAKAAAPSAKRPPVADVIEKPVTVAAPDVFQLRGQERWPTLDEVLALQAKPATADGL